MGKNIKYGEFTFSKPKPRPAVKGYAFGGATEPVAEPMTAKQPMGMSPPPPVSRPVQKPVVTPKPTLAPMSPAQKLYAENKAVINKANARDGGNRLIDRAAMDAAVNRNMEIRKATDARHKAEAKANAIPSKNPYARSTMPIAKQKGGKVGLWDNIHAKRERIKEGSGEKMRKAGSKGAPSAQDFKNSAKKMQHGGEVKGYAAGGDYQADDAPIQRRNAKVKAMKLRMAEQEKMDDAKSKRRYEAEQEMIQSKANLLPSPVRMQKGGEVQGYASGGILAKALQKIPQKLQDSGLIGRAMDSNPQPTPNENFGNIRKALQRIPQNLQDSGLIGGALASNPQPTPTPAPNENFGNIRKALQRIPQNLQDSGLIRRAMDSNPQPAQSQNMGNIRKALQRISPSLQGRGLIGRTLASNTGFKEGGEVQGYAAGGMQNGYAPPPNIQQLASLMNGTIPDYAQPYINQPNQFRVNALTQAGMPPQMSGSGIGNIGVGTGTGTGTMSAFKRGGSVSKGKAMESSAKDKAQDKAMIKKAMKQHDQQEHKGGKGTVLKLKQGGKPPVKGVKLVGMKREPQAVIKKEISLLKKAGAPAKMIKHEEIEAMSPMSSMGGMRKGGSAMKKGVPTFNRTPKC